MRVTHVNDVAHVGGALVAAARRAGLSWDIWSIPEVRDCHLPRKFAARAIDVGRFARVGRHSDILHIHYGLFAYYAYAARRPYVLHLHGSDVRLNLKMTSTRRMVEHSIMHAARVFYSTPDLRADVTALRPDAEWLPAPVAPTARELRGHEPDLVVFGSRWEPFKGSGTLLVAARTLRNRFPHTRIVGINWGSDAHLARDAGLELLEPLKHDEFRALVASATALVGQVASGCIGVTEVEAMLAATPVVTKFDRSDDYGSTPPVWNTQTADEVVRAVTQILEKQDAARSFASRGSSWASENHGADKIMYRLQGVYSAVLTDTP